MAKVFGVAGIISEPKNGYFEKQIEESSLVKSHFHNLLMYEKKYVGDFESFPVSPILLINANEINQQSTLQWAIEKSADVVLLFGTGILSEEWLLHYKKRVINLHLGYSPRYRGSATLFWPFVNEELDYVGATIHLAELKVDAGEILEIITPEISKTDSYYDINFKTIKKSIDAFPDVVQRYLQQKIQPFVQNNAEQKFYYRKKDFTVDLLKKVLDRYGP